MFLYFFTLKKYTILFDIVNNLFRGKFNILKITQICF